MTVPFNQTTVFMSGELAALIVHAEGVCVNRIYMKKRQCFHLSFNARCRRIVNQSAVFFKP